MSRWAGVARSERVGHAVIVNGTESKRRDAERSGDPLALLKVRFRLGELSEGHVELAARLGHAVALDLVPDARLGNLSPSSLPADYVEEQFGWPTGTPSDSLSNLSLGAQAIEEAGRLLGTDTLDARLAADYAERVLHIYEVRFDPAPLAPRQTIAAAQAWAAAPSDEFREAARVVWQRARAEGLRSRSLGAPYAAQAAASAAACRPVELPTTGGSGTVNP